MSWSDKWVGIPYRRDGRGPDFYDCYGLFGSVQLHEFDTRLLDPEAVDFQHAAGMEASRWSEVSEAEKGDALLFRIGASSLHIAVALDGRDMLHAHHRNGSCVEQWNHITWLPRLLGIYRHERRTN